MIEGLHLAAGDHVPEIGTGLGFQTWLLQRGVVGWRGAGSAVMYRFWVLSMHGCYCT
jgi:hypothetical protein